MCSKDRDMTFSLCHPRAQHSEYRGLMKGIGSIHTGLVPAPLILLGAT